MLTERLHAVVDRLVTLPEDAQDEFATHLEGDLRERERIAAQLADPQATDLDYLLERARRQIAAGQVYDLDEWLDADVK